MTNVDLKESEQNTKKTALIKFTIENDGNVSESVKIYWQGVTNTFCQYENNGVCTNDINHTYVGDEINYTFYECNEENYETVGVADLNGSCALIGEENIAAPTTGDLNNVSESGAIEIVPGTKYYVLMVGIDNRSNIQDYNQGKIFTGKVYVDLYANETTDVEGLVVNEQDEPQKNVLVTLHSTPRTTTTDENGYYKFEDVPYGNHKVIVGEVEKEITIKRAFNTLIWPDSIRTGEESVAVNIEIKPVDLKLKSSYRVNVNVDNGTVDKLSQPYFNTDLNYTLTPSNGYTTLGATMSCDNGITASINGNNVSITNATTIGECNVTLYPIVATMSASASGLTLTAEITVPDPSKIATYHFAYTTGTSCEGLTYTSSSTNSKTYTVGVGNYKLCAYVTDKANNISAKASASATILLTYSLLNSSYSCANGSKGAAPYVMTYTGNCTVLDDSATGVGNWKVKLTTKGNLTFTKSTQVDIFLVGGGGGGASCYSYAGYGPGGGGGYTKTHKAVTLAENSSCQVTIGAGGTGGNGNYSGAGGESKIVVSEVTYSAPGGERVSYHAPGSGGSGGGKYKDGILPGSNGSDGGATGQHSTTCEFGEGTYGGSCNPGVTLYAGGGGGYGQAGGAGGGGAGGSYPSDGVANTGGGGGGGNSRKGSGGGNGGTGIVIIRNKR